MKLLTKVAGAEIVASGSNSNGEWVKFGNGILMQWGSFSVSTVVNTQLGSMYYNSSPNNTITFPLMFTNVPDYTNMYDITLNAAGFLNHDSTTTTTIRFNFFRPNADNVDRVRTVKWLAIGKWK